MRTKKSVHEQDEQIVMRVLGERLKQLREAKGWSATELVKIAGIDRDSYAKTERGERNVTMGILCNIADGLEIMVSEIFNDCFRQMMQDAKRKQVLQDILNDDFCRLINKKKVVSLIKRFRKNKRMSQYILSLKLGVSRDIINNLEYGRGKVKWGLLVALMDVMELSLQEFLKEIDAIDLLPNELLNNIDTVRV